MPTPSQHAFSEKVALITDGANPFGRAVAMQLALYGSYVIVGYPESTEEDKRVLDELKSLGTLANAVNADTTQVEGTRKLVNEVENLYGRLDLLVNCLELGTNSAFDNTNEESFDQVIDSGLKRAFLTTQEALRLMSPRPKPKIVSVVSTVGSAKENSEMASAIRTSLGEFTSDLAKTLPSIFRVNAVAVGTENGTAHKAETLDEELFRPPSGVDADDVARVILFLLSSESIGINGQTLRVD